jgi:hypothetical protein
MHNCNGLSPSEFLTTWLSFHETGTDERGVIPQVCSRFEAVPLLLTGYGEWDLRASEVNHTGMLPDI